MGGVWESYGMRDYEVSGRYVRGVWDIYMGFLLQYFTFDLMW